MLILATGNDPRPHHSDGFTLIELLVVIAILGLASATILFTLPDPRGKLVEEAERFAARAAHVRDEAVLSARDTKVETTATGYSFAQFERGEWTAITSKPIRYTAWSEGTSASVTSVQFDTSGLASNAQSVLLMRDGVTVAVQFTVGGAVNVAP